jgi:hypothetical protein
VQTQLLVVAAAPGWRGKAGDRFRSKIREPIVGIPAVAQTLEARALALTNYADALAIACHELRQIRSNLAVPHAEEQQLHAEALWFKSAYDCWADALDRCASSLLADSAGAGRFQPRGESGLRTCRRCEVSARTVAFLGALMDAHAVLLPLLETHLEDHDDAILAHMLMADIERWFEARWRSDPEAVQAVLDCMEEHYKKGHDEVQELIAVSFLEMLPLAGPDTPAILRLLGPEMAAEARRYHVTPKYRDAGT